MLFIVQGKFRKKPTKETGAEAVKLMEQLAEEGVTFKGQYWTLGRYDTIAIVEAKDEKTLMKALLRFADIQSTETLVAVSREEAIKLVK
jgi:uncharacterized protein with GYD domain